MEVVVWAVEVSLCHQDTVHEWSSAARAIAHDYDSHDTGSASVGVHGAHCDMEVVGCRRIPEEDGDFPAESSGCNSQCH